jgi:hypothetical protein
MHMKPFQSLFMLCRQVYKLQAQVKLNPNRSKVVKAKIKEIKMHRRKVRKNKYTIEVLNLRRWLGSSSLLAPENLGRVVKL